MRSGNWKWNASTLVHLALSLILLDGIFWLSAQPRFYHTYLAEMNFAIFTFCFFVVLLRTRWVLRDALGAVAIALLLHAMDTRILGYAASWQSWLSLLGLAAFGVLSLRVIWTEGEERRLAVYVLVPLIVLHSAGWCTPIFHGWTSQARPAVLDLYLYSFDASLGAQLSFLTGRLFAHAVPFFIACLVVYLALQVALTMTYAGCLMKDRKNALAAFVAFVITGPIGVVFYNLFPALGPKYLFAGQFPWHALSFDQTRRLAVEPVVLHGVRNAMPSLHTAWALLVFWYSRRLTVVERILGAVVLVCTLFATLGTGEHYLIDLIVAAPFTLFILALTDLLVRRGRAAFLVPFFSGLALTLVWFAALRYGLRFFWIGPVIPWGACVATVAASVWIGWRLHGEEELLVEKRGSLQSGHVDVMGQAGQEEVRLERSSC